MKKLQILGCLVLFSGFLFSQQDSIKIQKGVLLFFDSTDLEPTVHQIPYVEIVERALNLTYKNTGQQQIVNYSLEFRISHLQFPLGVSGIGLLHRKRLTQDSIAVNELKDFKLSVPGYGLCYFGRYKADFSIVSRSGTLLDSTSFIFDVTDTSYVKSNLLVSSVATGPSLFIDTVLNQSGGTAQGDRFGTLFEVNELLKGGWTQIYAPTSVSFYILNDTSNVGAEIGPRIWKASVDSVTNKINVGQEVASSFIPFTITNAHLGQLVVMPLGNGTGGSNGLTLDKYIVGFESTLLNPNGKSLLIGRDII